jgi:phage terminase small subunit
MARIAHAPVMHPDASLAHDRAMHLLGLDAHLFVDAVARYSRAVDVAARVRDEWADRGYPTMLQHTNGAMYDHPLVKQLRAAERDAATHARQLGITPASEPWERRSARQAERRSPLPF